MVYVSEYAAPENWKCVWEKRVSVNFDVDRDGAASKEVVERLFTREG